MDIAKAKAAVRDADTGAYPCMRCLDELLGPTWLSWEPETLWLELDRQGVSVPISNREQIMAGRSLITTGRFWYDALAFEKTCIAFNNEEATHFGLEDAPVAYIAWAVDEATMINRHYENEESLEFDREPTQYIAVQLYREGFVITPDNLKWVTTALHNQFKKFEEIRKLERTIKEAWAAAPRGEALADAAFPETPEGVQLARLAAVHLYYLQRSKEQARQLAVLGIT